MNMRIQYRYVSALSALCGLLAATPGLAAPLTVEHVDSSGREWASVAETGNLSYNQVNAACGTDGQTACTSDIGAIETTGWTWATRDQVRDLFVDFGIAAGDLADYRHDELDSAWASAALSAFTPTTFMFGFPQLIGITSTIQGTTVGVLGNLLDRPLGDDDVIELGPVITFDDRRPAIGAFLFRQAPTPTPVPEPATGVLLLGGLLAARLARRRR